MSLWLNQYTMQYITLNPNLCDSVRTAMQKKGWEITHQDVGQTELVGYGYVIVWEKGGEKALLHYADRQGVAEAQLEVSDGAQSEINTILKELDG